MAGKRRRHLLTQKNTVAVIQRSLATSWICQVYIETVGKFVGAVMLPVLFSIRSCATAREHVAPSVFEIVDSLVEQWKNQKR